DEVFVLPRGEGGRLPWRHEFDTHLGFTYKISKDNAVTVGMDIFNMFNFQAITAVDERFTSSDLRPYNVDTASSKTPQQQICIGAGSDCSRYTSNPTDPDYDASLAGLTKSPL